MKSTLYISNVKGFAVKKNRHEYMVNLAIFVVVTGVLMVFSGYLHYVALSLPKGILGFAGGIWIASASYLTLS